MRTASKRWDLLDNKGLKVSLPQSCSSVVENIKPDTLSNYEDSLQVNENIEIRANKHMGHCDGSTRGWTG